MWPFLESQADISEDDYMHNLTTWPFVPSQRHRFKNCFHVGVLAPSPSLSFFF